jgi:low affinity Fe/Cu permease
MKETPMDDEKSLKEIIREELHKLSGMTWGKRLGYIWDYYKPLMAAILGILLVINIGVTIYRNKQLIDVVNVYMVDCNSMEVDTDEIKSEFADYIGGLEKHEVITIDDCLEANADDTSQYGIAMQIKRVALATNGDMDLMLLNESAYEDYLEKESLKPMDDLLTEEQKDRWSDLLIENDGEIYGVNVQDSPVLQRYNAYGGEPVYACVALNASHLDMCVTFLEYLFTENTTGGQDNG